jgi:hypothetical protein
MLAEQRYKYGRSSHPLPKRVKEGEPGHKVLLESSDCVFRSAASMTMRRHQLIRDITDGEEILHGGRCFVVKSLKLWPETFDSEFLMDAVICFDPFLDGPLLHGNDFKVVAIIDITYHDVRVSFAGSYRELDRQVGVELTLIDYDCVQEVVIGAQVWIWCWLFLNCQLGG